MKTIETFYRTPFIDELVKGFTFERFKNNQWVEITITQDLTKDQIELYQELIETEKIRIAYQREVDETVETETISWYSSIFTKIMNWFKALNLNQFKMFYSAIFSVAFLLLFFSCIHLLNYIDVRWGSTAEGQVMPTGIKLLQLIVYVLGIHSGGVTIAKVVDWTSSNLLSYVYENPYLKGEHYDKYTDVNNLTDLTSRRRLAWHDKRFYTFYFVSISLVTVILSLKMYLQVN